MPSSCCRNQEALEKWPAGRQAEIHSVHIEGLHPWTGSKKSVEYKKLLLGNDSRAVGDLAESPLKSESDSS